MRRFTVSNPTPFHKSVDVLNYGLGIDYLGKIYGGWQKGAFEFTANGTAYMVWFPKLSMDGKPAFSSGWINTTADDGRTIIEKASESNHELGYVLQALLPQRCGLSKRIKGTMTLILFSRKAENPCVTGIFDKKEKNESCNTNGIITFVLIWQQLIKMIRFHKVSFGFTQK